MSIVTNEDSKWKSIYKIGAAAALGTVLVGTLEILITFLPGGNTTQETVLDWFMLLQDNWFLGLRNLGLINIILNTLAILIYFALYAAHRNNEIQPYAALAMIISFIGIVVFFATNRAFPMLDLSRQYTIASTDSQRAALEAAAQSMLSVGQSHSPGTFLAFSLIETAGIMMSVVMLHGGVFTKINAWMGILGFSALLVFEMISSFVTGVSLAAMGLAIFAGLLTMVWDILTARRLFQLGNSR